MWNEPTEKQLAQLPKLGETEDVPTKDKMVLMHFFIGSADWYAIEFDGEDIFFGFADLGDPVMSEWGYFSLKELKELVVGPGIEVDRNLHWPPTLASEIPKIKTFD